MDAEIKRLASLKNKDKSDSLSDKKTPQEAKANSKENATANVVQQTRPSSSSNTQSKTGKPSDSRNPSVDSASETSSATDAETPKAKRGRKKKSDAQTANAPPLRMSNKLESKRSQVKQNLPLLQNLKQIQQHPLSRIKRSSF